MLVRPGRRTRLDVQGLAGVGLVRPRPRPSGPERRAARPSARAAGGLGEGAWGTPGWARGRRDPREPPQGAVSQQDGTAGRFPQPEPRAGERAPAGLPVQGHGAAAASSSSPAARNFSNTAWGYRGIRLKATPVASSTALRRAGAGRDHRALAQGLGPEGPGRVAGLHEGGVDLRGVQDGGQLVVQQVVVQGLAGLAGRTASAPAGRRPGPCSPRRAPGPRPASG